MDCREWMEKGSKFKMLCKFKHGNAINTFQPQTVITHFGNLSSVTIFVQHFAIFPWRLWNLEHQPVFPPPLHIFLWVPSWGLPFPATSQSSPSPFFFLPPPNFLPAPPLQVALLASSLISSSVPNFSLSSSFTSATIRLSLLPSLLCLSFPLTLPLLLDQQLWCVAEGHLKSYLLSCHIFVKSALSANTDSAFSMLLKIWETNEETSNPRSIFICIKQIRGGKSEDTKDVISFSICCKKYLIAVLAVESKYFFAANYKFQVVSNFII